MRLVLLRGKITHFFHYDKKIAAFISEYTFFLAEHELGSTFAPQKFRL